MASSFTGRKFTEFRRRYEAELAKPPGQDALTKLREQARQGAVTLVFAARDMEHSNAAPATLGRLKRTNRCLDTFPVVVEADQTRSF